MYILVSVIFAQGTGAIFRKRCYDDRVLSDVRSEFLRTDACDFYERSTLINLKSLMTCREISVLVERFFHHVADTYTEWEEQPPCGALLPRHRSD